ncbi:DoxX family protein [Corynebacterium heidelbergense]|uniref:DoxX family protein n=1 Tax=Corynebacterium heidelbergense TaxID=2055947 RepID=A0A364VBA9_9CORY|nr:DoxX family protein [Corynebacterium heidelbergense]RAV33940.1 hypothetical protein CWC39_05775 [Corynebacterium heidelbergense]WCZ36860.1 DoxX [Corynebacterium heidelbergense]
MKFPQKKQSETTAADDTHNEIAQDVDETIDVPDYEGGSVAASKSAGADTTPKRDIYAMTGRARPQKIDGKSAREDAATEVIPAQGGYEDTDFAEQPTKVIHTESASAPTEISAAPATTTADSTADTTTDTTATDTTDTTTLPEAKPADPTPGRGTTDFGLLILRVVTGALLLVHGLQTLFTFGGDPGIDALSTRFEAYRFPDILALVVPISQVAAGGLLVLGLLTPLAAAVAFVITGFLALHNLNTFSGQLWPYALNPMVYLWALFALITFGLVWTGPGRLSLDRARQWSTRPRVSSTLFALLGLGGLIAGWLLLGGGNPLN